MSCDYLFTHCSSPSDWELPEDRVGDSLIYVPVICAVQTFNIYLNELVSEQMNESQKEVFACPCFMCSPFQIYPSRSQRPPPVFCLWNNALSVILTEWRQNSQSQEYLPHVFPLKRSGGCKRINLEWLRDTSPPSLLDIHLQTFAMSFSFWPLIKPAEIMGKLNSSWLALNFFLFEICKFSLFLALTWVRVPFSAGNKPVHPCPSTPPLLPFCLHF